MAPTKDVYGVMTRRPRHAPEGADAHRQLSVMRWGLVPSWAKDPSIGNRMINARMETLAEKPSFRRAFAKRRCLLPADGYYEWYTPQGNGGPKTKAGKPQKQPFFIHRTDGESLAMAGLYEWWRSKDHSPDDPDGWLLSTTVITTSSSDALGRIHERMPLVVSSDNWTRWLDPDLQEIDEVQPLLVPAVATHLSAYPVSTRVNNVRNNGPDLIEPLPLEEAVIGTADVTGGFN